MSLQVRPLDPSRDEVVSRTLDAAFARTARESRMASTLAAHPDFDPELSLIALENEAPVGAAIFMPRRLRILGRPVAAAACAPFGVVPSARGRGAGRALLEEGMRRLREYDIRCLVAIGPPEFFAPLGFGPAFNLYCQRVPTAILREHAEDKAGWRGLRGSDLAQLAELESGTWSALDGSEVRGNSALDWEASATDSHALCSEHEGRLSAYLRFRVREAVEITDCCLRDARSLPALFALLVRLGSEHARELVELRLPPAHPLVRAAFRLGCPIDSSDFGGASQLAVLDWRGLFEDLGGVLAPHLLRAPRPSLSLGIEGANYRLAFAGGRFVCSRERDADRHIELPPGLAPELLTGKCSGAEVAFELGERDPAIVSLLDSLFPQRCPTWSYGPIYEIADD